MKLLQSSCINLFCICKLEVHFYTSIIYFNFVVVSGIVLVAKSLKCYEGTEVYFADILAIPKDREEKDCEDGSVCIKYTGCTFHVKTFWQNC